MPGTSPRGHLWEDTIINVSDASDLLKLSGAHIMSCLCIHLAYLFLRDLRSISRKVATGWTHQGDAMACLSHSILARFLTLRTLRCRAPPALCAAAKSGQLCAPSSAVLPAARQGGPPASSGPGWSPSQRQPGTPRGAGGAPEALQRVQRGEAGELWDRFCTLHGQTWLQHWQLLTIRLYDGPGKGQAGLHSEGTERVWRMRPVFMSAGVSRAAAAPLLCSTA